MTPLLRRLRSDLFATPADGALSLGLIALITAAAVGLVQWATQRAQWAVIQANSTLFAVGRYPADQQWRLWLLTALLTAATGVTWG
jgi:general L-amino acid transport system permease protein